MTEASTCPSCGATIDDPSLARIDRCPWCGAIFASPDEVARPMLAKPRLSPDDARRLVASALSGAPEPWTAGTADLVFYPFAKTGSPREPLAPLADLPPALREAWRPAGTDLVADGGEEAAAAAKGAARVEPALEPPAATARIDYPFYRVALRSSGRVSAAWCDALSGQVLAPDVAASRAAAPRGLLERESLLVLAASAAGAIVVPFPYSLAVAGAALGVVWWKASR